MAPDALARAGLVSLLLGLAACGGRQKDEPKTVDLAAIRAHRDSLRLALAQDSTMRARYTACADSVQAALAKAAHGKKSKKVAAAPAGMISPEVLQTCGKPPAAAVVAVQKADTAAPTVAAKVDTAVKGVQSKADTAARVQTPAKPALTAKQLQVLRADSLRLAKERARQDSLKVRAERALQDSVATAQRDSVRNDSLRLARETEVQRETFTYAGGARDPFASLITEDKIGPEFNDLLLVGVYLDLRRVSNSVAVVRDKTNQKRFKLRVGDRLGRLKVAQIRQTDVVFTVEDIGFERQETLSLRKREEQTP